MSSTYKLGTSVKVSVQFDDVDGVAGDPATVLCYVQKPSDADGVRTTYTYGTDDDLVKDGTGAYHLWIEATEVGTYVYGFKGDGGLDVANSATFDVETDFR